ncbi:MAG: hypothetical protein H6633_06000 [Anaerolineales bacterium]|nr:hypothetical protein [Anaerolineales bacterium]
MAYGGCHDIELLAAALTEAGIDGALYLDINDPQGIGLITMAETPDFFVTDLRQLLNRAPFAGLTPKPEYTMLGPHLHHRL